MNTPTPNHKPEGAATTNNTAAVSSKVDEARKALLGFRRSIAKWAITAIATPYDSSRLRNMDAQIDDMPGLVHEEQLYLKQFVRTFGKKDRKRPRDRLLRDRATRGLVMEVRKRTAFLGYTWRRMRPHMPMMTAIARVDGVDGDVDAHQSGGDAGRRTARRGGLEGAFGAATAGAAAITAGAGAAGPSGGGAAVEGEARGEGGVESKYRYVSGVGWVGVNGDVHGVNVTPVPPKVVNGDPSALVDLGLDGNTKGEPYVVVPQAGYGGYGQWGDDVAALRALHRGMSWR